MKYTKSTATAALRCWAVALVLLGLGAGCNTHGADGTAPNPTIRLRGRTMGTSYSVVVPDGIAETSALEAVVDSALAAINAEVNTYDATSQISLLNAGDTLTLPIVDRPRTLQSEPGAHLAANLRLSDEPVAASNGRFDPTVGPLVDYYGFGAGFSDTSSIDPTVVAQLLERVGYEKIVRQPAFAKTQIVYIAEPGVTLDLSAIAKGYAVDQLGLLLTSRYGIADMLVEIGGETRVWGDSPRGETWNIAINTPEEGASITEVEAVLAVRDRAVATSGNYRNVRIRGGERYVHTIDPRTGGAQASSLLSATVVASDCATADAFATACMAAGEDAGEVLAKAGLEGCLIYAGRGNRYDVRYVGEFEKYLLVAN